MADDGRQYEPTPYDLDLTDAPGMSWPEYQAARDTAHPELAGVPARPCCIFVPEAEHEAGL